MSFVTKGNTTKRNSEKPVEEFKCVETEIEALKRKTQKIIKDSVVFTYSVSLLRYISYNCC